MGVTGLTLDREAILYVLFQRTELLPVRRFPRLRKLLAKVGLAQTYEAFVRDYAEKNVDRVTDAYAHAMEREARRVAAFLPEGTSSILDIGCGIAALDLFLHRLVPGAPMIHLLDRTKVEDRVYYLFEKKGAFYNSLDLARKTLEVNGVPAERIETHEAPEDGRIPLDAGSIDAVISTISWGFHYPIETYADSVHGLLSDVGVVVVDVRKGTNGVEALKRRFTTVEEVDDIGRAVTVRCRR